MTDNKSKILPKFPTDNRHKCRAILASILGSFASKVIGLAYEGISSFLHHKRHKALHKAVAVMNKKTDIQHNRIHHLEDTMIMYDVYNSDTLTDLIDTVHRMQNFLLLLGMKRLLLENYMKLGIPVLQNWTTQEQILPLSLETFEINPNLLNTLKALQELPIQYQNKRNTLNKKEQELDNPEENSKFRSFLNSFLADILIFTTTLITFIITLVIIYVTYGQSELKSLVMNIAMQRIRTVEAADMSDMLCTCKTQWYIMGMLTIITLGMLYLVTNKLRKSSFFKGCLFSNNTKIPLFISNTHSYVPIKLCRVARSIHLFRIKGRLNSDNVKLKKIGFRMF